MYGVCVGACLLPTRLQLRVEKDKRKKEPQIDAEALKQRLTHTNGERESEEKEEKR